MCGTVWRRGQVYGLIISQGIAVYFLPFTVMWLVQSFFSFYQRVALVTFKYKVFRDTALIVSTDAG